MTMTGHPGGEGVNGVAHGRCAPATMAVHTHRTTALGAPGRR